MTKRRDPNRAKPPNPGTEEGAPPEQSAVERAIARIVERLKPKPPRKGKTG